MSPDQLFDVVVCGAGASGLAVAQKLANTDRPIQVAILDPDFEHTPNKTWCLWDSTQVPESLPHHSWKHVQIRNSTQSVYESLNRHRYICIKAHVYRETIIGRLKIDPRFQLIKSKASSIVQDGPGVVFTKTESGQIYQSKYVVDARFNDIRELNIDPEANTLWQHFKGWEIRTRDAVFDPESAVMMDFRVPQTDGFAFVYLLPYSSSTALVELTYFNTDLPDPDYYDTRITDFLEINYGLSVNGSNPAGPDYIIEDTEYGVIPMTDIPYKAEHDNESILSTGLIGGQAKASTGYAFARSQRYASIIVDMILGAEKPTHMRDGIRFRYYDLLMLHIIRNKPDHAVDIFMQLFRKNGIETMFDFLDEKTTFLTELKIMASVPDYLAYFRAMWATKSKIRKIFTD